MKGVLLGAEVFPQIDLAVETVVEDLGVKRDILARVEGWLPERAVLTTNTSSFSVSRLAQSLSRPESFAGLHFLNPAHLTRVVEVVPGPGTSEDTVALLARFSERMGKVPLLVRRDVQGFIWNRIQFAVLRECLHMLDQGIADIASIDAAVSDGLAPRWAASGPFATADLGGLDTFSRAAAELFPLLASETTVSPALAERAATTTDFYSWTEESRAEMVDLRDQLLVSTEAVARRRRGFMPRPTQQT